MRAQSARANWRRRRRRSSARELIERSPRPAARSARLTRSIGCTVDPGVQGRAALGGFGDFKIGKDTIFGGSIINAVKSDTTSNLLQFAPSVVMLDNQGAKRASWSARKSRLPPARRCRTISTTLSAPCSSENTVGIQLAGPPPGQFIAARSSSTCGNKSARSPGRCQQRQFRPDPQQARDRDRVDHRSMTARSR